jgi:hypothetical protein
MHVLFLIKLRILIDLVLCRLTSSASDRKLSLGISSRLRLVKRLEGKEEMDVYF